MISIITPVYKKSNAYIEEAYASLIAQSYRDWEWILLTNAGGKIPKGVEKCKRVRVFSTKDDDYGESHNRIGRLKKIACERTKGDSTRRIRRR